MHEQQLRKLRLELEQIDPDAAAASASAVSAASPSSFAEHMRASQLKRECAGLQAAAREFYTRPSSAR